MVIQLRPLPLDERGPDELQVPEFESVHLLCGEPGEVGGPGWGSNLEWLFLDEYGNTIGNDVVDDGRRCVWSLSFRR